MVRPHSVILARLIAGFACSESREPARPDVLRIGVLPDQQQEANQSRFAPLFAHIEDTLKFRRPDEPPTAHILARIGPSEQCEIRVRDNGIGFAPEHAEKILGMFQRLHARTKYEGTGIGLALCRRIAEAHGGTITAQASPGKGAEFIVVLPQSASPGQRRAI